VMEIWTIEDVKAGDEMFINYSDNFVACPWYDKLCMDRGLTPLSKLAAEIDSLYTDQRDSPATISNRRNSKTDGDAVSRHWQPVPGKAPWKNPPGLVLRDEESFSREYPTEFRPSATGAGMGWWAIVDIPANTRLRRVTVQNGSLHSFPNEEALRATGWNIDDAVHYGIGHKADPHVIYYLDPGTACNHADPTRTASVKYKMEVPGEMEIWSITDIKAGEEMFIDYADNFGPCPWYDAICAERGLTPLSQLAEEINKLYMDTPLHAPQPTPTAEIEGEQ